jgi:transposase
MLQRLALTNQICGLLLDRGSEIAQGFCALRTVVPRLVTDEASDLTHIAREVGHVLLQTRDATEAAIAELSDRIQQLALPPTSAALCSRVRGLIEL